MASGGGPSSDVARSARRLLLISYHFPPSRAAGALRWQKLSAYASERGWGLDVVCLAPNDVKAADPGVLLDLPADTRVIGVPDVGPMLFERVERSLWAFAKRLRPRCSSAGGSSSTSAAGSRQSLSRDEVPRVPISLHDWRRAYEAWASYARDRAWALKAEAAARAICDPACHDAVITCGPPHMVHDAGRRIAARTGLPHVMDLRDPWSEVERLPESVASPVSYLLAARHERRCVSGAALVIMNTEPARERMRARYPERAQFVLAVTNGCDEVIRDTPAATLPFRVVYAGSMYLDRDPRPLLRATALVVRELGLGPDAFRLEFIGHVSNFNGIPLTTLAREEGIAAHVTVHASMPRRELFALLRQSAVLVNLAQDSDLAIPSKIYEYAGFPSWLLAFAEPHSATALLLRNSGADVVRPDDSQAAASMLRRSFLEYQRGVRPAPIAMQERFTRRHQAGVLFDALRRLRTHVPVESPSPARSPV